MARDNPDIEIRMKNAKLFEEGAKEYFKKKDIYVIDFAWANNKKLTPAQKIAAPKLVWKMPDLMIIHKNKPKLIEVKQGRKEDVMMKLEDLKGYKFWQKYLWEVFLFIGTKPHIVKLDKVLQLDEINNYERFWTEENKCKPKEYFNLPYKDLHEKM